MREPEGTSFWEYPKFGAAKFQKKTPPKNRVYSYGSEPKDRPGTFRVIANSINKTYVGIINHDGTPGNPAGESFHCVHKAEESEELKDREKPKGENLGDEEPKQLSESRRLVKMLLYLNNTAPPK